MSSLGSDGVLKGSVGRLVGFPASVPECGGAGGSGGQEVAERGRSSRKTGGGVKWSQVFRDKPDNPSTSPSTPVPSTNWSAEVPAQRPENRRLFPASLLSLPFFCLLLSKHLIRLISSTRPKLQPSPLIPGFFSPSRPCAVPTGPPGSGL